MIVATGRSSAVSEMEMEMVPALDAPKLKLLAFGAPLYADDVSQKMKVDGLCQLKVSTIMAPTTPGMNLLPIQCMAQVLSSKFLALDLVSRLEYELLNSTNGLA